MKRLLVVLLLCNGTTFAGSSFTPEGVVRGAIQAAQKDQLSFFIRCIDLPAVASNPRNPLDPQDVLGLLKRIDETEVKLIPAKPARNGKMVVRMIAPASFDFELKETHDESGTWYVIVGIHPVV